MREHWEMDSDAAASYQLDPSYTASGANWCGERRPAKRRATAGRQEGARRGRPHTAAVCGAGDNLGLEMLKARFQHRRSG
ncbi:hypothetical protein I4I73_15645 [Pseudonocardia sp. KRD-184]|uniref:Uncharacterized protein n=1 Tax=Pseudonocardia oceani TaxID=2792013 RepID=A0ABS6U8D4_9PSEU|nr:hypothetical protein [Pseudonocardia oceani]MBW0090222.1 hypothetical protein [Pseudonocardia oceani]MBW0097416.1 hypothetical protein [Pseudonocardia oceani]MBW0124189.1 hypothetical protein [Pseudonocardia oceani]MBW0128481.1 hypothetical protein [Pseudonocardia oceani]